MNFIIIFFDSFFFEITKKQTKTKRMTDDKKSTTTTTEEEEEEEEMRSEKEQERIIRMNIGGMKFTTTIGTLTKTRNFFSGLLSLSSSSSPSSPSTATTIVAPSATTIVAPSATTTTMTKEEPRKEMKMTTRDEKGRIFIDREGKYFGVILEFLRTGELFIPEGMSMAAVRREAEFYGVDIPRLNDSVERTSLSYIDDGWLQRRYLLSSFESHKPVIDAVVDVILERFRFCVERRISWPVEVTFRSRDCSKRSKGTG